MHVLEQCETAHKLTTLRLKPGNVMPKQVDLWIKRLMVSHLRVSEKRKASHKQL